ncbi:MAG: ferritin-like domain-containing protein [Deltaproteobacteria bacterium]|nr:ferritin-like domain-containing protein [Deltaproteobacteria bacterium]
MPLINFGSILSFAEDLEKQDEAFYAAASANPAFAEHKDLFDQFLKDARKNIKNAQRTRRENVTEMILEPIKDFTRAPYCEEIDPAEAKSIKEIIESARCMEKRAERYYNDAAIKIKALSEVSRALKTIGKKHTAHLRKLDAL